MSDVTAAATLLARVPDGLRGDRPNFDLYDDAKFARLSDGEKALAAMALELYNGSRTEGWSLGRAVRAVDSRGRLALAEAILELTR